MELYSNYTSLQNSGYDFSGLFRFHGWKRLALFAGDPLAAFVHDVAINAGADIACVVGIDGENKFVQTAAPVIKPCDLGKIPGIDVVLLASPKCRQAEALVRHYSSLPVIYYHFLLKFVTPEVLARFKEVEAHVSCAGAGLLFLNTCHPTIRAKNRTIREKSLVAFFAETITDPYLFSDLYDELYADIEYRSLNYFLELLHPPGRIEIDGAFYHPDMQSKYMNIVNHNRLTTGVPEEYDNTIYIFGECTFFGCGTEDRFTVASHLQRLLNRDALFGKRYRVVNASLWGKIASENFRRVLATPFRPGDLCVMIEAERDLPWFQFIAEPATGFGEITNAFDRPHDQGEVFIDFSHFTHRGALLVAREIKKRLLAFGPPERHEHGAAGQDGGMDARAPGPVERGGACGSGLQFDRQLAEYRAFLEKERVAVPGEAGAIVMNCNPFTLGHRYLIERAARQIGFLYIFCVEEDKSFFPFIDRIALLREGVADMPNVKVLGSGKFVLSSLTLPDYFHKDGVTEFVTIPTTDIEIFGRHIAPVLGITVRFAGEEPLCQVTAAYNRAMREVLPRYGIRFVEIGRKDVDGAPISASRVREYLKNGEFEKVRPLVPETTFDYLLKRHAPL